MKEHFLTYEQSLAVKELGFNEPCLAYYNNGELIYSYYLQVVNRLYTPLKSQFFKWVREKYGLSGWVNESFNLNDRQGVISVKSEIGLNYIKSNITTKVYDTYEQAEDACINKIIEILKLK